MMNISAPELRMRAMVAAAFASLVWFTSTARPAAQTAAPPSTYDAITDRVVRPKGPVPVLGAAGYEFTDPDFGSRIVRITDGATRPAALDRSYRTPSGVHSNAWSADGRHFYATSTDGTALLFGFDPATRTATRMQPSTTGNGGLTARFFNEPTFSYLTPGVMYGTYNGSGGNLRSVDQFDLVTGQYTQLVNLDTLAPNMAGTYAGSVMASAGPVEKIITFFGGTSQDRHFYLLVFEKNTPTNRHLLDTTRSTVDGVITQTPLNFKIHGAAIDRSGRYVTVYPTATDQAAPRSAAPAYVWDMVTNTFAATPLAAAHSGGHDAYGYGYRVNQDCCTSTTWDAAQWQLRSLATPLVSTDLIRPVLLPKEVFLADHPSWHNAQPDRLVPFISANYRYGTTTVAWRPWDEEIIAVQTSEPGTGGTVWRFAHHRSKVANDTDPSRISFWYTPRMNVSPDGRWALFTSNWEKTLGTDPRGEAGGTFRQDLFLIELQSAAQAVSPVAIGTTAFANGTATEPYSAALQATGGSGAFTWSITAGTLPDMIALDASGSISGTPTTAATSSFTVRVSDTSDSSNSAEGVFSLTVAPAPLPRVAMTTTTVPNGTASIAYSSTLQATGGSGAYAWSLASGALPAGLMLNPTTGVISGKPSVAGLSSFTLRAADATDSSNSSDRALGITIVTRVAVATTSLPGGTALAAYSQTLQATGGSGAYRWTVVSGILPAGLLLSSTTGAIAGTPTVASTRTFRVRATDASVGGNFAERLLTITVAAVPPTGTVPAVPVIITTTALPSARTNVLYSATLTASGGSGPLTWSVVQGTLPPGYTLNPTTGVISGSCYGSSLWMFKVQAADSSAVPVKTTRTLSITVVR